MRAAGDDWVKARARRAPSAHLDLEPERQLALALPGQTAGDQLSEGVVRERRRGPDRGDLLGLLDRAQALDQPFDADQLDPVGQPVAQPTVRADRHVDGLEPEPKLAGSEHVADRLEQVLRRAPALERRVDLLGGLLDVAKVGDEHPRVRPDQRDAVTAGVAGEVARR